MTDAIFLKSYQIRRVEESLLRLFGEGKIKGTIHTCLGQELTGLAVAAALEPSDTVVSNHRCHGHYLARYADVGSLIGEILGKPSGICRGFGGSQHIHREGFYSSGIQGGMLPCGVGMALAKKKQGGKSIVVNFIGDGTLGQGIVYEALNIASLKSAPLLVVVEKNGYAQSTDCRETLSGTIQKRSEAFGIQHFFTSTFDLNDLFAKTKKAIDYVRGQMRPALLEIETYRLGPHSKGDDLRSLAEISEFQERDLLNRFLKQRSSDPLVLAALEKIDLEICEIVSKVERESNSITIEWEQDPPGSTEYMPVVYGERPLNQVKSINAALKAAFESYPDLMLLGEDLHDPYGGAFKISNGLSSRFSDRVFNMPISEASIVGVALGLALEGRRTIAEIMFGDFVALAFDQLLNHASKMSQMFGKYITLSLLIRTPMGGGRGYGATHSQSLEKFLLGIPQLDLFVLHPRVDAGGVYRELLQSLTRTAVVVENKSLYSKSAADPLPAGYYLSQGNSRFGNVRLRSESTPDITVVAFGATGSLVEKAADLTSEDEIWLDVFYPLHVSAPDLGGLIDSVNDTGRILFVEEGTSTHGLSSEYLRRILQTRRLKRLPEIEVIGAADMPVPAAGYLEEQMLPNIPKIHSSLLRLYDR